MPPRSRSSTVTSTTSSTREHLATNPDELVGAPTSDSTQPGFSPFVHEPFDGPKSYASEHSLRTIRPTPGRDSREGSPDDRDHADDDDADEPGAAAGGGRGHWGRRAGPQFVIDLDAGTPTDEYAGTPALGGRPRSSTFGGVELPPAPSAAHTLLENDYATTSTSTDDTAGAGVSFTPRPDYSRRRSTSLSSLTSLRSLDPALHLGGAPLRERRPMLYAGLQAGGLLVVSVLGLWLVLKGLLPPIDPEHQDKVKLPKSFDDLKSLNEVLQVYSERNYWRVMASYVVVYLFLQTFSVPGSMYLSILGGALWGVLIALPLVCFCVATGALLCYLMSAALGPAVLRNSEVWRERVEAWTDRVAKHDSNLVSYLIVLRIAPLPPHWMVNVVAPHLGISVWKFWLSTFLGIAGVSYIHTTIGTTLDQMTSSSDFHLVSWQNGLGLGGIVVAVLIPVLLRRAFASDLADAATDPTSAGGDPLSSAPLLHPRSSLSLDDGGGAHGPRGTRRELLDGTTRSSTDGSARVAEHAAARGTYHDEDGFDGEERGEAVWGRRDEDEGARPVLSRGGGSADKELAFTDKVVIVTGAGGGLGRAYTLFFASRGAKVLVNDLSRDNADKVVAEVKAAGKGDAIANYDSATEGDKIVKQVVDKWGRVDILINNAGILRDKSFKSMTDKEWDIVQEVHVKGAYACTKAAWPIMRKQKFGRIVNTASAAGIYGNFGQANYSAAKMGLVGFAKTLAREGAKYGIHANAIAPVAASQMTETVMPPEMLAQLSPEMIVPLVAYLSHESTTVNGQLFEAGAGWYGRVRWERTKGHVFKTDKSFTPAAVKAAWDTINDFTDADHPENITDADYLGYLEKAKQLSTNKQSDEVRFDDKTVLITGAGAGLGRAYALMFAKGGANVVVNDMSADNANKVVDEIKTAGGKAVAVVASTLEGEKLVKASVDAFGALHTIICNAGILRDKSFAAMTEPEWDAVYATHLKGTYAVAKAAWPLFQKQRYGRIVTTASSVGVHGNFGQANYSTAKSAIIGLTRTLAIEGKKYGIQANVLVPNAGTSMTATIWPEEMVKAFAPDFVAPVVCYLGSEACDTTMGLYEVSGGWCASLRWQRSYGYAFPVNKKVQVEDVAAKWDTITRFDDKATNPNSTAESLEAIVSNFANEADGSDDNDGADYTDPEDSELVADAKKTAHSSGSYDYTERDIALYNLGIGATEKDLDLVFEGDDGFKPVPTFGVIPQFAVSSGLSLDWLPNFSPMMLLHGEQYLEIKKPIPTSGSLVSESRLAEVLDKGKAAAVTTVTQTKDASTGEVVFENHSTVFIRGAGGFGGRKTGKDRGAATALNKPPSRKPDAVVEEKTLPQQAAIYRLSGDANPLHVDPDFAKVGGFDSPILHGLCSFGISGKHIFRKYGPYRDIKTRFSGVLYPGETLITEMWKEGNRIVFQTKCKERGTLVLAAAGATLVE
ncbi:hypothetical protein JCM3775_007418 [Rhodotorula graminis]